MASRWLIDALMDQWSRRDVSSLRLVHWINVARIDVTDSRLRCELEVSRTRLLAEVVDRDVEVVPLHQSFVDRTQIR
jgi:hypothetical protein